jgi:hypothetical protein
MNIIVNKKSEKLLENVPDFFYWNEAIEWIKQGQKFIKNFSLEVLEKEILSLEWSELQQKKEPPFGLYPSKKWRKFVLAAFFADITSYPKPVDQVNFERLLFVMHAFPQGFRIWWIKLEDDSWWPVGYSGWYPMVETMFEIFEKNPDKLKDRMIIPYIRSTTSKTYLYLFNFSVAPEFKKSRLSKILINEFIEEVSDQDAAGLACIVVSSDGIRIANRCGMSHTGDLNIEGNVEGVYVKRF